MKLLGKHIERDKSVSSLCKFASEIVQLMVCRDMFPSVQKMTKICGIYTISYKRYVISLKFRILLTIL